MPNISVSENDTAQHLQTERTFSFYCHCRAS
jgi:hypothetical protein